MKSSSVGLGVPVTILVACGFPPLQDVVQTGHVMVAVEAGGGGGVVSAEHGISCGMQCSADVPIGTTLTFTATPPDGSTFIGWRGAAASCGRIPTCSLAISDDLTLSARFARSGTAAWVTTFAGLGADIVNDVATDRDGNSVAAVYHSREVTFDGITYPSHGNALALVKISPAGDVVWVKSIDPPAEETFLAGLAMDRRNGDFAIWGTYTSDLDLGGISPLPLRAGDNKDIFVAKYTRDGLLQWQLGIHRSDDDDVGIAPSIAIDAEGNIIIAGSFFTSIDFGDGPLSSPEEQVFAAMLSGLDGSVIWKTTIGETNCHLAATHVVADSTGVVFLGAHFTTVCNIGTSVLTPVGMDALVVKLSGEQGNILSVRQISSYGDEFISALSTDSSGNVYVAATYNLVSQQPPTLAGQMLAGAGSGTEIVVGKFSRFNNLIWATRFGTPGVEFATALAILGDGYLGVVGGYSTDITFGSNTLVNSGSSDGFVLRLNPGTGAPTYAARISGPQNEGPGGLGSTGSSMIVVGRFQARTDVVGIVIDEFAGGTSDAFVASIALPTP